MVLSACTKRYYLFESWYCLLVLSGAISRFHAPFPASFWHSMPCPGTRPAIVLRVRYASALDPDAVNCQVPYHPTPYGLSDYALGLYTYA
eukprot:175139-Rhodomonas_salina.3